MELTQEQKRQYHTDGVCRIIEIKEHLIAHNIREALLKHAPFKTLGTSEDYPTSVFADAYVAAIEAGDLEPVQFQEDYNAMVERQEYEIKVRQLQSTDTVYGANSKPFARKVLAEKFQVANDLTTTHEIRRDAKGFFLKQLSPARQKELRDQANGIKDYVDLQKQAFIELGLEYTSNADGELVATDEQWALIDARIDELQQAQYGYNKETAKTLRKLELRFYSDNGLISREFLVTANGFENTLQKSVAAFLVFIDRDDLFDESKIVESLKNESIYEDGQLVIHLLDASRLKKAA